MPHAAKSHHKGLHTGRHSLRRKLLKLALAPLLVAFPAILVLLVIVAGPRYDAQIQSTVRSNLASAHNYFDQQKNQVGQYVEQMAHSDRLPALLADPQRRDELNQVLKARAESSRLDFLIIADHHGRVIASSDDLEKAGPLPDSFVLRQGITGVVALGYEKFGLEELSALSPDLADRTGLSSRGKGDGLSDDGYARNGLLISAAAHFPLSNTYPDAILYGGFLLNNDFFLIDRVRDVVFPVTSEARKLDGVAALFMDDVQIVTTLFNRAGERAVGTRAPDDVTAAVLTRRETWAKRAMLLGNWYVSGYEPILDTRGEPVGMLFAGFPEQPYRTEEWLVFGSIAGLLAISMLGLTVIFQKGTKGIVRRLASAMTVMKAVQAGDRHVRVDASAEDDEIAALGRHFNELLDALWAHEDAREAYITERNLLNAELEKHRFHLEELVFIRTKELAEARDEAESASRAKSTFLANMSHELRTPMNGIMGMTELALLRASDPKEIDYLNKAKHASVHLLQIINDILEISNIEADRITLEHKPFMLGDVLEQLEDMLSPQAVEKALQFATEIADDLRGVGFEGDARRLQQVLSNLTSNAIKFTQAGSIVVRVLLEDAAIRSSRVRFEIQDTGIGMSDEECVRLFKPFEQADDSLTRKYGGTGLGLAICKRLVTLMGGQIGVNSTPNDGSTFWFVVDLMKAPPVGESHQPDAPATTYSNLRGRRILLVEDDPINQEVAMSLLSERSLKVQLATDGYEALDMVKRASFDLILMDIQMPGMNGIETAEMIRLIPEYRDTPILAMTANAFDEDRDRCLAAGMNGHIAKPVVPAEMFATIDEWLAHTKEAAIV